MFTDPGSWRLRLESDEKHSTASVALDLSMSDLLFDLGSFSEASSFFKRLLSCCK